jgi:hypothetical protein
MIYAQSAGATHKKALIDGYRVWVCVIRSTLKAQQLQQALATGH